jgi:hypothetical protein
MFLQLEPFPQNIALALKIEAVRTLFPQNMALTLKMEAVCSCNATRNTKYEHSFNPEESRSIFLQWESVP